MVMVAAAAVVVVMVVVVMMNKHPTWTEINSAAQRSGVTPRAVSIPGERLRPAPLCSTLAVLGTQQPCSGVRSRSAVSKLLISKPYLHVHFRSLIRNK